MKTYKELQDKLNKYIEQHREEVTEINDYLANHPEPSGYEKNSSAKIVEFLRGKGFTVEYPFCGFDYAFHAVYGDQKHTRKAGIFCAVQCISVNTTLFRKSAMPAVIV